MQLNIVFQNWLNSRKITDQVLQDFGICGEDEIVIPVHDMNGDFIFNKYRRSPLSEDKPKYWYDKGGKVTLYGSVKAKDSKTVLITEGEMDCLVAWSANIPAVTSTGGAMSFQEDWKDYFSDKEVIICYDNDNAGGEGMVRTLKVIPHAKILFLPSRDGVKDISDYITNGGDLHTLLQTARHFTSLEDVKSDRSKRLADWRATHFHDAYIKAFTKVVNHVERKAYDTDRITNAKLYPIPNLLEFSQNKTCCPFHNEKTPSLHYYAKTNSCYCFGGCGKAYDSISIYMKKFGVTFPEAIKQLNELV